MTTTSEHPTADPLFGPLPGDRWCGECKRWVAPCHISPSHTHDSCSYGGCGYHTYEQEHPAMIKYGLPKAEVERHG